MRGRFSVHLCSGRLTRWGDCAGVASCHADCQASRTCPPMPLWLLPHSGSFLAMKMSPVQGLPRCLPRDPRCCSRGLVVTSSEDSGPPLPVQRRLCPSCSGAGRFLGKGRTTTDLDHVLGSVHEKPLPQSSRGPQRVTVRSFKIANVFFRQIAGGEYYRNKMCT